MSASLLPSPSHPCNEERLLTHEVVTLWYRAPEILLGMVNYGYAADLWSIGCIFAEMASSQHQILFQAERTLEIEVIFNIFRLLGSPTEETWPNIRQQLLDWSPDFPQWQKRPLLDVALNSQLSLSSNKKLAEGSRGLDLLEHLLELDPRKRITASDALCHGYFAVINTNSANSISKKVTCLKESDELLLVVQHQGTYLID